MNRLLKNIFLDYDIYEQRVIEGATSAVVYECGLFSDYLNWLLRCMPVGVDIIELRSVLKRKKRNSTSNSNLNKLGAYRNLFFHSPGEVLQRKLLENLRLTNFSGQTIGIQHGFIGKNPPAALSIVLGRCRSDFYISFEREFTQMLSDYANTEIVEYLYKCPLFIAPSFLSSSFVCYLDAPDKGTMLKNLAQLKNFLVKNSFFLSEVRFHPSTSFVIVALVRLYLKKCIGERESSYPDQAICWESKVKYELSDSGIRVFSFDESGNLCELSFVPGQVSFEEHFTFSLESFIAASTAPNLHA